MDYVPALPALFLCLLCSIFSFVTGYNIGFEGNENIVLHGDIEQAESMCKANDGVESISREFITCKNQMMYGR